MHLGHVALFVVHLIRYVGHGGDDIHIELAAEALLHNLHVQQTQEAAAEAEAQGCRTLGNEGQRGVVELQLLQRGAQVLEVLGLDGVDAGEDHRLDILEAVDGLGARAVDVGDGIAHTHLAAGLDARDDVADVAGRQGVARRHLQLQHTDLVGVIFLARADKLDKVVLLHRSVDNLEVCDDAAEGVEYAVKNQRLQRRVGVALRSGDAVDDGLQNFGDAHARLARGAYHLVARAAKQLHNLVLHLVGLGRVEVALVDYGDNLQIVVDGHVEVRDGLRLYALRGVHDEQRALAGGNRARHLVREVDVSRGVDEVERVLLAVVGGVLHLYGVTLDCYSALALQLHVVKHLGLHVLGLDGAGVLEQAVGQRRLAVVDVRYYAEVANMFHIVGSLSSVS